jgi:hypothetical protein
VGIVDLIQCIVLAECASAEFGCCPDGKHPAHGENFMGRYRNLSRQRKTNLIIDFSVLRIRIRDPGWEKFGSGIRDGKKSEPGTGIQDPGSRIREPGS